MATMKFTGIDEYVKQLNRLTDRSAECVGRAVYQGAGVIADEVKTRIENLPVNNNAHGAVGSTIRGVTQAQKRGLIDGFGITKIRSDGTFLNVKLGFAGYNTVKTKKYPQGQPNSIIARSVESGTSFRQKTPFIAPAVKAKKNECEQIMKKTLDDEIRKLL